MMNGQIPTPRISHVPPCRDDRPLITKPLGLVLQRKMYEPIVLALPTGETVTITPVRISPIAKSVRIAIDAPPCVRVMERGKKDASQ